MGGWVGPWCAPTPVGASAALRVSCRVIVRVCSSRLLLSSSGVAYRLTYSPANYICTCVCVCVCIKLYLVYRSDSLSIYLSMKSTKTSTGARAFRHITPRSLVNGQLSNTSVRNSTSRLPTRTTKLLLIYGQRSLVNSPTPPGRPTLEHRIVRGSHKTLPLHCPHPPLTPTHPT